MDDSTELAKQFEVHAIPTLIFFKGGEVVDRITGLADETELKAKLAVLAGSK